MKKLNLILNFLVLTCLLACSGEESEPTGSTSLTEIHNPSIEDNTTGYFNLPGEYDDNRPINYRADIKNVILIVIDTLRANHMGCYGYYRDTTPAIDAIAARSVVFENAYTPQSITTPAFTALFTGMHPAISGVTKLGQTWPDNLHSLVECFQDAGFRTTGAGATAAVRPDIGFDRGMDDYRYDHEAGRAANAWEQIEQAYDILGFIDETRTDFTIQTMMAREIQLFMMVHFWEPHSPMTAPSTVFDRLGLNYEYEGPADGTTEMYNEYNTKDRPMDMADLQRVSDLYDGDVKWLDGYLGAFFNKLEEMGLFDDSLIVITADHGEALGENHRISHGGMTEVETHIPLIFHFPYDRGAGTRVPGLVDITDILPTVMDICGMGVPGRIDGASRLPMIENPRTPGREYVLAVCGWMAPYTIWDGEQRYQVDLNPLVQDFDTSFEMTPQEWEALRSLGYIR